MLTPVDIQQKKFHVGLGYDKKDVNTFFDSVSESYESLYRSNAELKEKVSILNDTLQNYRSKESHLEKSLKRAEKDTEETITNATKEAKEILRDAKIQAANIVESAEKRLSKLEDQIVVLEAQYAAYKSNFASLLKKQFEFLGAQDFDPDSMIDDRAFELLGGAKEPANESVSDGFGAYTGDPQMRDESTLGGFNGGYGSDVTSTSAVYTQSLSAGENFVDPFKPQEQKDYNPFDVKDKSSEDKKSSLKVANSAEDRKRMKRATVGSSEAAAAVQKAREAASQQKKAPEAASKKEEESPKSEPKPKPAPTPKAEEKTEPVSASKDEKSSDSSHEIPTILHPIHDDAPMHETEDEKASVPPEDHEHIEGEVEAKPSGSARIGDGSDADDTETDDDGFEFI